MATKPERRKLTFESLEEIIAEAERLARGEVRTTGHHTFGQILNHLAVSQNVSSGLATAPPPPFFMRLMRPIIKRVAINSRPLKPGIKLPAKGESFFWPNKDFEVAEALQHLKESSEYYNSHGPLAVHPFFGKLTTVEADSLNYRHAALHLSFVHPV